MKMMYLFCYYTKKIQTTIKHLKNNKSPGVDVHVNPNEFNKSSSQTIRDVIHNMFNTMLVTGLFPEPWTISIAIPLFKKG